MRIMGLLAGVANSLVPSLKKSQSGFYCGYIQCLPLCRILPLRRCLWTNVLGTEARRERMRPTEPLAMSRQKEHLNRILGSASQVQSLDPELELLPVPRTRIEQTESVWQLQVTIELQLGLCRTPVATFYSLHRLH